MEDLIDAQVVCSSSCGLVIAAVFLIFLRRPVFFSSLIFLINPFFFFLLKLSETFVKCCVVSSVSNCEEFEQQTVAELCLDV